MSKYFIGALALLLVSPALVFSANDDNRSPRENAAKSAVGIEERGVNREENQKSFASSSAEREAMRAERKESREQRREEIKAKISEKIAFAFEKVFGNMEAIAERLAGHSESVAERIAEFESTKGIDLSVAKEQLEEADELIGALADKIEEASQDVADLLGEEQPATKREEIKEIMGGVKAALKEAHMALVEAIREIKSADDGEEEGNATTTEEN